MTSLAAPCNPPLRRGDVDRLWQFMRIWMPLTVRLLAPNCGYGVERLPARGGAVVAVNHFSAIDPPLVGIY